LGSINAIKGRIDIENGNNSLLAHALDKILDEFVDSIAEVIRIEFREAEVDILSPKEHSQSREDGWSYTTKIIDEIRAS
jgi:hypothetical protein